jgi:hypothetical protein
MQGLMPAKQVVYHLSHSTSLFLLLVIFQVGCLKHFAWADCFKP